MSQLATFCIAHAHTSWKCSFKLLERKGNKCTVNIFIICLDFVAMWITTLTSSFTPNVHQQQEHTITWTCWHCRILWVMSQILCSTTCLRMSVNDMYWCGLLIKMSNILKILSCMHHNKLPWVHSQLGYHFWDKGIEDHSPLEVHLSLKPRITCVHCIL